MENEMLIRAVNIGDAQAICSIYNYYVMNTAITFETSEVSVSDMRGRIEEVLDSGLPYFVAVVDNKIVGYCYIHRWNGRCAYSSTKELSIYLDKNMRQKGVGSQLFDYLLSHVDYKTTHVLISGICIPNKASVRLHEKFGFKKISHMKEIGRKFDEWRDVGHWELILSSIDRS